MRNRWNILAWSVLGLVFAGMSLYLILHPDRTGVVPNYRHASTHWWAGENIYDPGTHGFLYAPSFAVVFTLFNLIRPEILGEILWRAFGFGLFAFGLQSLSACSLQPQDSSASRLPHSTFFFLVFLAVPASLASLNNGQTNLPLSACLVLTALALRGQRWAIAGSLLTVALLLKPIALAPWLLAFAVFTPVRRYLLAGILGLGILSFLHPSPEYAWQQQLGFFHKLSDSYTPENLRVSDFMGALGKAGFGIAPGLEKGIRAVASLAALVYLLRTVRGHGMAAGAWGLWVASALVFTIFNPRAETNGYVLISPLLAFAAISRWQEGAGGRWKGIALAAACIGLMCDGMGLMIYRATDVWLKPLIVLVVSPLLFRVPEEWEREA